MEITKAYARRLVREGKAWYDSSTLTESDSLSQDDGWIWGHIQRRDIDRVDCYRVERASV